MPTPEQIALIHSRLNIHPGARDLRETPPGIISAQDADHPIRRPGITRAEAAKLWPLYVEDAYKAAATVSDIIVDNTMSERQNFPPKDSKYDTKLPTDLEHLKHGVSEFLRMGATRTENDMANRKMFGQINTDVEIYDRYMMFRDFAARLLDAKDTRYHILNVGAGISTAANFMNDTLRNILELWKVDFPGRPMTIRDLTKIARNSWPYLAEAASGHRRALGIEAPLNFHMFEDSSKGLRLEYSPYGVAQLENWANKEEMEPRDDHPAFGCPALVNFGNGSPIRRLWDWHVELVEKMYKNYYRDQSVFRLENPPAVA